MNMPDISSSVQSTIAQALHHYLATTLNANQGNRRFFRLDGFDEGTYRDLLDLLERDVNQLGGTNLEVRTTAPLEGKDAYVIEEGKSATWYRNNVNPDHALILIFNRRTSDAQSLKDIYPVTETFLASEGQNHLIEAAFDYDLRSSDIQVLKEFVARYHRQVIQPQLRNLVAFFLATDAHLTERKGLTIKEAIAQALPFLNLFKSRTLAKILGTSKADRLLTANYKTARIGLENLEEKDYLKYQKLLSEAEFDDESDFGGLNSEAKKALLERFIADVITDQMQLREVLHLDWDEVAPILYKAKSKTKADQRRALANDVKTVLQEQNVGEDAFSDLFNEALEELTDGREPDGTGLEELISELDDLLPNPTKRKLTRLRSLPKLSTKDFLSGLMHLAVELIERFDDVTGNLSLHVAFNAPKDVGSAEQEAIKAFHTLYGGITHQMPSVTWQLDSLQQHLVENRPSETEEEEEKLCKVMLSFTITIESTNNREVAELNWDYRSDGTAAATTEHLSAEWFRVGTSGHDVPPIVPIYNTSPKGEDISDLDLAHPVLSLSAWYRDATSLRRLLETEFKPKTDDDIWTKVDQALRSVEQSWTTFVTQAYNEGIIAADIYGLTDAYENLLNTCAQTIRSGQEATYVYRILTQVWMIGPQAFDDWAVMPPLHPLKLHWWLERARRFESYLKGLGISERAVTVADVRRFQNELETVFNSAGYPAVVALAGSDRRPAYFLPVLEYDGYELYRRVGQAALAYGLSEDLASEEENRLSAAGAVQELAKVIRDYIETYPFVKDGLEVYLVRCRNGSLPGLLVQRLDALAQSRGWQVNLNIIVHTEEQGAPIYQRVNAWLNEHNEYARKDSDAYFPRVTLKVLQSNVEDLYRQVDDTDIVILPDVLAEKGLQVETDSYTKADPVPTRGYLPLYTSWQDPHTEKEMVRDISLTSQSDPSLLTRFHAAQWAAHERKPVPKKPIAFSARTSLQDWEQLLIELHKRFNWVVCYDTTVDRFLLEATVPESAEVIRYSVGLGPRRRHNLTVSTSAKAQRIVINRLASRLDMLLPNTPDAFREEVASKLVSEAKIISGDLVLRAAGPGAFLNELIGVVASKRCTEQRRTRSGEDSLTTWIYLDDFAHWFERGKFPDLLFVTLDWDADSKLHLRTEVIEAKCVDEGGVSSETADAKKQVLQGLRRLKRTLSSQTDHLDRPYWLNQFYQALVGNLSLTPEKVALWQTLKEHLREGDFNLHMSGHAWVFCYRGSAGLRRGTSDEHSPFELQGGLHEGLDLTYHLYNRKGLRGVLRNLVEDWQLDVPDGTWETVYDLHDKPIEASETVHQLQQLDELKAPDLEPSKPEEATESSSQVEIREDRLETDRSQVGEPEQDKSDQIWLRTQAKDLERALRDYGVQLFPIDTTLADIGPNIVRYKIRLRPGEQLSKVQRIAEDLVHRLALKSVPLIDNVLGTTYVGIDLPSQNTGIIRLLPLLEKLGAPGPGELPFIVGQAPDGQTVVEDLSDFPHLLVAGATNSGKSVFLRSLLLGLMHQYDTKDLRLLIVDPKRTDFSFFNDIPYLLGEKVITDKEEARALLLDLVQNEMVSRQKVMSGRSLRIKDFNQRFPEEALPLIVAVIDEYAQLISIMSKRERDTFEQDLMSLAAVARSTGIHLILATQRPSADVVTGTLKANLPASIAFKVASAVNSRIVIDQAGAENLLGKGDMLFRKPSGEVVRLQAPFLDEVALQDYMQRFRD